MAEREVVTPPVLVQRRGKWFIEIVDGEEIVLAPVGDGAWLLEQIVEKIVAPRLRGKK